MARFIKYGILRGITNEGHNGGPRRMMHCCIKTDDHIMAELLAGKVTLGTWNLSCCGKYFNEIAIYKHYMESGIPWDMSI